MVSHAQACAARDRVRARLRFHPCVRDVAVEVGADGSWAVVVTAPRRVPLAKRVAGVPVLVRQPSFPAAI